jgi:hypothetical protein
MANGVAKINRNHVEHIQRDGFVKKFQTTDRDLH